MTILALALAAGMVLLGWCYIRDLRLVAERVASEGENSETSRASPLGRYVSPFKSSFDTALQAVDGLKRSDTEHKIRYQILTDNVAAAVVLHEADGLIDWCSPYTEVLTGYSRSEIYENRQTFLTDHVHEQDRDLIKRALSIVGTGEPFQCRYRAYHRSGLLLWLEMRTVPIFDSESSQYTALSVMFDVTTSVNNQLQAEERNRDLHEFTYMLSHDLKAPLFTIKGMLGIIKEDRCEETTPALREPLEYIGKATTRLESLVGGVLELAKVSAFEKAADLVPLSEIAKSIEDDYARHIRECGGALEISEELPTVLGNARYLYQIFSNLVGNAYKYRSPERPLRVSITLSPNPSPRRVTITVRDNGRGIPEEKLGQLFKPFQRIGEEGVEGTGIGLACVKRLTEKLGGEIRVESKTGEGTCFTLELRKASR